MKKPLKDKIGEIRLLAVLLVFSCALVCLTYIPTVYAYNPPPPPTIEGPAVYVIALQKYVLVSQMYQNNVYWFGAHSPHQYNGGALTPIRYWVNWGDSGTYYLVTGWIYYDTPTTGDMMAASHSWSTVGHKIITVRVEDINGYVSVSQKTVLVQWRNIN